MIGSEDDARPTGAEMERRPPAEPIEEVDDLTATEGLDDDLIRRCRRLLAEEIVEVDPALAPGLRPGLAPAARRAFRQRMLVARLAFEAGLLDRARAEADAAHAIAPAALAPLRLVAAIHHRRGEITEALERWDDLAGAARASLRLTPARPDDAQRRKLASLRRASLLEHAGDVPGAVDALERLADAPTLAADPERLAHLSRLYEREGSLPRRRRAIRACLRVYQVSHDPCLLHRLARLLEGLGHPDAAAELEARYLEIYRRRLHALSLRELTAAASLRFVPLDRLRALGPPFSPRAALALLERHLARHRPAHHRRAAMLALLLDDLPLARALLGELEARQQATVVDLYYLGEVLDRLGDPTSARAHRLRALRADPSPDAAVLLCCLPGEGPLDASDRDALKGRLEHGVRALRAFTRAAPGAPEGFRALGRIERALGRAAEADEHDARAAALVAMRAAAPGAMALAATTLHHAGEVRGLLHDLWVEPRAGGGDFDAAHVLGASEDLRAHAVDVYYAVLALVRARWPHRLSSPEERRFVLKLTRSADLTAAGGAGLPMALVFLAALTRLRIPDDLALAGVVASDAHDVVTLAAVGDVDARIEAAYERRLGRLFLPAASRGEAERTERIPRAIATELVHYARTLEDVAVEVFPELR